MKTQNEGDNVKYRVILAINAIMMEIASLTMFVVAYNVRLSSFGLSFITTLFSACLMIAGFVFGVFALGLFKENQQ